MTDREKSEFGAVIHRGKTYNARYKRKGKLYSKTFNTRAQAWAWLEKERNLIIAEAWKAPKNREKLATAQKTTFEEFVNEWLKNRTVMRGRNKGEPLTSQTKRKYRELLSAHLLPTFGKHRLTDITSEMIKLWHEEAGGINANTRHTEAGKLLNYILISATHEDSTGIIRLEENPYKLNLVRKEPQREHIILTHEDIEKANALMDDRLKIAIYLGCYVGGCRNGELRGLQRKHFNLEDLTLTIEQQAQFNEETRKMEIVKTKTRDSHRVVPIPEKLLPKISEHLNTYAPNEDDFILTGLDGGILKAKALQEQWRKARKALPEEKQGAIIHHWRNTYATNLLKAGITDIKTLTGLLGHHEINMTLLYQTSDLEQKHKEVKKLDSIIPIAETEIIKPKPVKEIEEFVREHTKITFDLETEEKTEKMTLEGTNEEAEEFHEISTRTLGEIEKLLNEELLKMTPEERLKFEERRKERSRQETLKALRLGKITREDALKILI